MAMTENTLGTNTQLRKNFLVQTTSFTASESVIYSTSVIQSTNNVSCLELSSLSLLH